MADHRFDWLDWCIGCGCSRERVADTGESCTGQPGIIPAMYLDNRRRSQAIIEMTDQILDEYAKSHS